MISGYVQVERDMARTQPRALNTISNRLAFPYDETILIIMFI